MPERRVFARLPAALTCWTSIDGAEFSGVIRDLSQNGLRLSCRQLPETGEELLLSWSSKSGGATVWCGVRHVDADQIGVEFLSLTALNRARIVQYLARSSTSQVAA